MTKMVSIACEEPSWVHVLFAYFVVLTGTKERSKAIGVNFVGHHGNATITKRIASVAVL